jgi:hypothetical protein
MLANPGQFLRSSRWRANQPEQTRTARNGDIVLYGPRCPRFRPPDDLLGRRLLQALGNLFHQGKKQRGRESTRDSTPGPFVFPEYTGIAVMRAKCPHFDKWLTKLEGLNWGGA